MKHEMRVDGNDTGYKQMIAGCTCGWWGTKIDGQGYEAHAEAQKQWREHYEQAQAEDRAA